MLSYQHSYHAGNHADVIKHILLIEVLAAMQQKASPLFLLDAFASRGIYDLASEEALKHREFDTGVGRIWELQHGNIPLALKRWFELIKQRNPDGRYIRFPGSTALLASMLREQDRLAACDLHPQEFNALHHSFSGSRRLALHKRDAFEAIKGLLPPKEKRGLVFLDPSYEMKNEYRDIARAVAAAHKSFASGVYVIWYPLLPAGRQEALFSELKRSGVRNILRAELDGGDAFPDMQMYGSGLLIVNPPWHARPGMEESLNWLSRHLTAGRGRICFDWLVPE
ncbi:MAG: 23S rRNA (adenine(2030)-N(6))-methyltransferase RlmJ [Mariprofundaceae bacterium]